MLAPRLSLRGFARLLVVMLCAFSPWSVRAQDCGTWLAGPSSPDLPFGASATAFATSGGNLYALASINTGREIFKLSGGVWSRVPWDASFGVPQVISTDNGALHVVTRLLTSDFGTTHHFDYTIRRFDGTSWSVVATMDIDLFFGGTSTPSFAVNDMAYFNGAWYLAARFGSSSLFNFSSSGSLYRSNGQAIERIASTNSASCTLACANMPTLTCLQVASGKLYIGGAFSTITPTGGSATTTSNLVAFNGTTFSTLPTTPNATVTGMFLESSIAIFNTDLVVWGNFTQVGSVTHNRIARWNDFNASWSSVGTGLSTTPVAVLQINGQTLNDIDYVAVGVFQAGGVAVDGLARWTGSVWQNYGGSGANALTGSFYAASNYQGVIVGGAGLMVNGSSRFGTARWNGSSWTNAATQGTDAIGRVVALHNNQTYVGGDFTRIDSVNANRIARRDDAANTFAPLGDGLNGPVHALISFNGELIAGGTFTTAGGTDAANVAAWNGTSWRALGNSLNGAVHEFTIWNGALIAVGSFQGSGATLARNVARWTGSAWEPVDSNFQTTDLFAAAVFGNTLYVGGELGMWRMQSGSLVPFGNITAGEVRALFPLAGSLYVGGTFFEVGSPAQPYRLIARYNGTQWFPVGPNSLSDFNYGSIESIHGNATTLLVGGYFSVATSTGAALDVARFDGVSWRQLPVQSPDELVRSVVINGSIAAIAGDFHVIGATEAFSFAQWSAEPVFMTDPQSAEVCLDVTDFISLTVEVEAGVAPQYRWRRNGTDLNDNLRISGATTPMLTIAALTPEDSGNYDCVVTNCGSVASDVATILVRDAGDPVCIGCPSCPADYDLDGGVTGSDIAAFFSDFEQGLPCADTDLDGGVTGSDIGAFFSAFEAGGC